MKLLDVVASAGFPLHGIHPRHWTGPAFVGDVERRPQGVALVQLVYLDALDANTMGAVVSNVNPAVPSDEDPAERHLVRFVSRFDPGYLVGRVKPRRRFRAFDATAFARRETTLAIAGHTAGVTLYVHRDLPLQFVRTAVRVGSTVVELGVGTWRLDVRELAARVDPIDKQFATEFDQAGLSAYPFAIEPPGGGRQPEE